MKIEERTVHGVTVLDLKGKLSAGAGLEAFRAKLESLVDYRKSILLNFAEVPYIDSAGLGELLNLMRTMGKTGGTLKLVNLTERSYDLLAVSKLLTVFEAFDNEADAIKSFGQVTN